MELDEERKGYLTFSKVITGPIYYLLILVNYAKNENLINILE